MKTYIECIPCFIKQTIDTLYRVGISENLHQKVVKEVLRSMIELDMEKPPPYMAAVIHRIIKQVIKNPDPYKEVKHKSNKVAIKYLNYFKDFVKNSEDPISTSLKLAIAANIIDLGAKGGLKDPDSIHFTILEAIDKNILDKNIELLKEKILNANTILYLTDNAGEIVFDSILIENISSNVIVGVRGKPVINDATLEDARECGLTEKVKVINNGTDIPGTILEECSKEFLENYEKAELIIAKGQGNFESLSHIKDKEIFFLLRIKCEVVARDTGIEIGKGVVLYNKY